MTKPDQSRLDRIVAEARRSADERAKGYCERALKLSVRKPNQETTE